MFTIMSRCAVAATLAIAGITACAPGVASAAKHKSARSGSHTATTKAMTQARHVVTSPLGGFHGTIGGTTVAELQGGSTGDGKLGEDACERLGELANEANTKGDLALIEGNDPQAKNSYDYANALVEYGLDNGCFFVY